MGNVKKTPVKPVAKAKMSTEKMQKIILAALIAFFVLSLAVLWIYASNKPNYRDLKQAYNKLNIPSDWQLVSEDSTRGTLGMFCFGSPENTSPCPSYVKKFNVTEEQYNNWITKSSDIGEISKNTCKDHGPTCYLVGKVNNADFYFQIAKISNSIEITLVLGNESLSL